MTCMIQTNLKGVPKNPSFPENCLIFSPFIKKKDALATLSSCLPLSFSLSKNQLMLPTFVRNFYEQNLIHRFPSQSSLISVFISQSTPFVRPHLLGFFSFFTLYSQPYLNVPFRTIAHSHLSINLDNPVSFFLSFNFLGSLVYLHHLGYRDIYESSL